MLFSETLASIEPADEGWRADVGVDWSQGRAVFGGMVAALGNEAMRFLVPADRPLRGLEVTFAGPVLAGEVRMQAEVLRVAKSATIAQAKLRSGGQTAAVLAGIYGRARPVSLRLDPTPPSATPKADELPDSTAASNFRAPTFLQHFGVRCAQGDLPFAGSAARTSKIYIRHRNPAPLTHDYGFAADAWWRIDTEAKASADGYCQESSLLIDPHGVTTAISRQLVAVFG